MGVAAGLGVGAGVATAWWRSERASPDVHRGDGSHDVADVWSAPVRLPDGAPWSLVALRGRPLLVNFWATWCVPCVTELPLLARFHATQPAAVGWQVVALAVDSPQNVARFLEKTTLALPIGVLATSAYDLPRRLGNRSGALPFSVLHDRDGRVATTHLGALDDGILQAWVASLN